MLFSAWEKNFKRGSTFPWLSIDISYIYISDTQHIKEMKEKLIVIVAIAKLKAFNSQGRHMYAVGT